MVEVRLSTPRRVKDLQVPSSRARKCDFSFPRLVFTSNMAIIRYLPILSLWAASTLAFATSPPQATNVHGTGVTYNGFHANEIEGFIGIKYGQDTSGENRFKPPRPYVPTSGSTIMADDPGPSCPQRVDHRAPSVWNTYSYTTEISEDCLALNVWRPNGTKAGDKLPVLLYIHGGRLSSASPLVLTFDSPVFSDQM